MKIARIVTLGAMAMATLLSSSIAEADDERKGVFSRLGIGPGFAFGTVTNGSESGWLYGGAVSTELSVGGWVSPEVVVGAGAFGTVIVSPTYDVSHPPPYLPSHQVGTVGSHYILAVGPFVEWHSPRGSLGVHGALLLAGMFRAGDVHSKINYGYFDIGDGTGGGGVGAAIGASYVLSKGSQGNVELVGRTQFLRMALATKVTNGFNVFVPSLLLSFAFHG